MIVVDTSALLAILNDEADRDPLLGILASDEQPIVSAVTLYETMLVAGIRRGPANLGDNILDSVDVGSYSAPMTNEPKTLTDAIRYFADPDMTLQTMVELRWPNGMHCPTCGRTDVRFIPTRRIWECKEKHAKRQFSAKVGTIFEDSALPLDKWFIAIWALANCKNGISSYELHRATGITQKSAWFVLHRVRLAMKVGGIEKMDGHVESDESFIGGLAKNMHKHKRKTAIKGTGRAGKSVVMSIIRRKNRKSPSKVRAAHIQDTTAVSIQAVVRTIKGTYVSVEPYHLGAYLDEQSFR